MQKVGVSLKKMMTLIVKLETMVVKHLTILMIYMIIIVKHNTILMKINIDKTLLYCKQKLGQTSRQNRTALLLPNRTQSQSSGWLSGQNLINPDKLPNKSGCSKNDLLFIFLCSLVLFGWNRKLIWIQPDSRYIRIDFQIDRHIICIQSQRDLLVLQ